MLEDVETAASAAKVQRTCARLMAIQVLIPGNRHGQVAELLGLNDDFAVRWARPCNEGTFAIGP